MPIYKYKCSSCEKIVEYIQKFSDPLKTDCTNCGSEGTLEKQISAPAIQFKGKGWYLTDYSDKGKKMKSQAEKEKAPAVADDSKTSKTESKKADSATNDI